MGGGGVERGLFQNVGTSKFITPSSRQTGMSLFCHMWHDFTRDFQFTCSSMKFFTDMKKKVKHAVDSSYEFNTSRAPDSIGRNASRALALLTKATFIYRVCLIASHLQPTEYRHMFHRISTSASAASTNVIHINTP